MATNLLDISPLGCHVWVVVLEHYKIFHPKPKNNDGLKKILQLVWDELPQDLINKAMLSVTATSSLCESLVGHFDHALR